MGMPKKVEAVCRRFAALDMSASYGGGAKSKGHGFWIAAFPPGSGIAMELEDARGDHVKLRAWFMADHYSKAKTVRCDGVASGGNPNFWMMDEAVALLERCEAAAADKALAAGRAVKAAELSSLRMAAGNEKRYSIVIDEGVVKEWVGIGWIELRPATDADRAAYPNVVRSI